MSITGPQAKAARALVQWPRDLVARRAGISEDTLAAFERGNVDPGEDIRRQIQVVLQEGGAVFIDENDSHGRGVRLKFSHRDVRSIRRLENEGGPVADDDV
ncbi:DNA-binding protein [Brevundimonas vesicularis]|uniref:DNA-binding protein n=1 Tax=Brevundimonas vesicularis TaxID=41276 RepID=UPI0038D48E21